MIRADIVYLLDLSFVIVRPDDERFLMAAALLVEFCYLLFLPVKGVTQ
jgi:hypothetical protein